jgi:hypothetical protein
MPLRGWTAGLLIAIGNFGPAAAQPASVEAVEPAGPGVLTKCRSWLMASSCRTYHHIILPSRIAVGDELAISFGSHPKEFKFFVARIALKDDRCTIFSEATGERHRRDKISITPCYPAEPAS